MGRKGKPELEEDDLGTFELNLETITDFGEDGLLVVDKEYRTHFANLVMRRRLRPDDQLFLHKPCYEVFENRDTPCSFPLWKCPLSKVLKSGIPARIIHLDYSPKICTPENRYVEIIMYPLLDAAGGISGFTETRRDVTAERGLERYIFRQHHHLQALNRISCAVSGLWDLDEILKVSLDGVLEIIEGTIGGILLLDTNTRTLRYRIHRGLSDAYVQQVKLDLGEGIAGRVAETGTAALVEDVSNDPRTAHPDLISTEGLKGFASVPLKSKENVVGVMNVASHEPGQFGTDDLYLLDSIGYQVGTAIEQARLYNRLDRARERYRTLLQHSLAAQEEARKKIARELHDETSQVITSLSLNIEALRSMAEYKNLMDDEFIAMFDRTQRMAAHAGQEVVRMMKELRPTLLDELGMAPAINRYARDTLEPLGIKVETDFSGIDGHSIPSEIEVSLFRISQGVIGNIREHSQARHVFMKLNVSESECVMIIRDDGKGFDPSKITSVDKSGRGAGLFIMKERVDLIGGTGNVNSSPGKGTEIVVRVPIRQEDIVNGHDETSDS